MSIKSQLMWRPKGYLVVGPSSYQVENIQNSDRSRHFLKSIFNTRSSKKRESVWSLPKGRLFWLKWRTPSPSRQLLKRLLMEVFIDYMQEDIPKEKLIQDEITLIYRWKLSVIMRIRHWMTVVMKTSRTKPTKTWLTVRQVRHQKLRFHPLGLMKAYRLLIKI